MKLHSHNHLLNNQALGFLPILTLMLLSFWLPYIETLAVSWGVAAIMTIVSQLLAKRMIYQYLTPVSIFTLLFFSLLLYSERFRLLVHDHASLVIESGTLVALIAAGASKNLIKRQVLKGNQCALLIPKRNALYEFFVVSRILQNLLTLHLLCFFFYLFLSSGNFGEASQSLLYRVTLAAIPLFVICYEYLRLTVLSWQLKRERWLPVVDTKGSVVGMTTEKEKGRLASEFQTPVIRIILVVNNRVLLAPTVCGQVDTPFDTPVIYGCSLEQTLAENLSRIGIASNEKPRFITTYLFDNGVYKTANSLYVLHIEDECLLKRNILKGTKLWTQQLIRENIGKNYFSKPFEQEFTLFRDTLFLPELPKIPKR